MRVLQVAAEVFPLVKTGGLADVVGALPQALVRQGADVRLVLPGYPAIADAVLHQKTVATLGPLFGAGRRAVVLAPGGMMPLTVPEPRPGPQVVVRLDDDVIVRVKDPDGDPARIQAIAAAFD